jgi:hypothetical protein
MGRAKNSVERQRDEVCEPDGEARLQRLTGDPTRADTVALRACCFGSCHLYRPTSPGEGLPATMRPALQDIPKAFNQCSNVLPQSGRHIHPTSDNMARHLGRFGQTAHPAFRSEEPNLG